MTVSLIASITELRAELDGARRDGRTVGFVPTMGYLHDGHVSLMERARADCDVVVASIFVNPLQFAAGEDLDVYPRDLDGDTRRANDAGVDLLFVPTVDEMYPRPVLTTVTVTGVSETLEGTARPTHFAGVATVVAKLFAIVGPCRAYFGEKDFQQLAVIRRMASDLSLPVDVVGCPTVREDDGLARSSRNVYLSQAERSAATILIRALRDGADAIADGQLDAGLVRSLMREVIAGEPLAELDYIDIVDAQTLAPVAHCGPDSRLLGAVRFGRTRLIDNVGVPPVGREQ